MKIYKLNILHLFFITLIFMSSSSAGGIRTDVEFQQYLDFANNKGRFVAGAKNVEIYKKDGSLAGVIAEVPDFSGNGDVRGNVTLFNSRYGASVGHMNFAGFVSTSLSGEQNPSGLYSGYEGGVTFNGEQSYYILNHKGRSTGNQFLSWERGGQDYYIGRFHKLVTSARPLESIATIYGDDVLLSDGFGTDTSKFGDIIGVGAGNMYGVQNGSSTITQLAGFTANKTGGITIPTTQGSNGMYRYLVTNTFGENQALYRTGDSGDSGSPLYIYDKATQKYYLFALHQSSASREYIGAINNATIMKTQAQRYTDTFVSATINGNENIIWNLYNDDGEGVLNQGFTTYNYIGIGKQDRDKTPDALAKQYLGGLTRDLVFSHSGENTIDIKLADSINHGAGALYFKGNYELSGKDSNTFWVGAGIEIDEGKKVIWNLKGMEGDALHKVGKGTLVVQGSGDNKGDISIGDGFVELNQKNGKAFNKLEIRSGRANVKLVGNNQIDFDKLYFGSNGGVLDINGKSISLSQFNAYDKGALIANTNTIKSIITLNNIQDDSNPYKNTNPDPSFKEAEDSINPHIQSYHGRYSGNIDLKYIGNDGTNQLILDGGSDTQGKLLIESNGLTLSGNPVLHAYNQSVLIDTPSMSGNHELIHFGTQPHASQSDWEINTFSFKNGIEIANGKTLNIGYKADVKSNINLATNSILNVGIKNNEMVYVDRLYGMRYTQDIKGENIVTSKEVSSWLNGDVMMPTDSVLNINNAKFSGGINPTSKELNGNVTIDHYGVFDVVKSSYFNTLELKNGSLNYNFSNIENVSQIPNTALVNVQNATFSTNSNVNISLPKIDFFAMMIDTPYSLLNAQNGIKYNDGEIINSTNSKYNTIKESYRTNNIIYNDGISKITDTLFIDTTLTNTDLGFNISKVPTNITTEQTEAQRIEAERLAQEEAERQAEAQRIEAERLAELERQRIEAERLAKEEADKKAQEEAERQRLEAERLAELERQRIEAERLAKEEADKKAQEEAERQAEADRIAREKAEAQRIEAERLAELERQRLEAERIERERIEAERLEAERIEAERIEAEKIAQEEAKNEALKQELRKAQDKDIATIKQTSPRDSKLAELLINNDTIYNEMLNNKLQSKVEVTEQISQTNAVLESIQDSDLSSQIIKSMNEQLQQVSNARLIKASNPIKVSSFENWLIQNAGVKLASNQRVMLLRDSIQSDVNQRLQYAKLSESKNNVWVNFLGSKRSLKSSSSTLYGIGVGYDRGFDNSIWGAYVGYGQGNAKFKDANLNLNNISTNIELAMYGKIYMSRHEVDMSLAYHTSDNKLDISGGALLENSKKYQANTLSANVRYGNKILLREKSNLLAFVGLGYNSTSQNMPKENISFGIKLQNKFLANIGLEYRKYLNSSSYLYLAPSILRDISIQSSGLEVYVNDAGITYTPLLEKNTFANILIGGEMFINNQLGINLNLGYTKGLNYKDDSLRANVGAKFTW